MEETAAAELDTANIPALPEGDNLSKLAPALRMVGGVVLALVSLAGMALAVLMAILTIINVIPSFLYISLDKPWTSLLSTMGYLVSIMCLIVISVFVGRLAYNLVRKQEITKKILVTCGIALVMALVCMFVVLPVSAAPIREAMGEPQKYFTNPVLQEEYDKAQEQ